MPASSERILDLLAEVVGSGDVRRDLDVPLYEEALLDSLRTVELMVALEEAFGIELSPSEVGREEWGTPRRIVAFVEARLGA